MNLSPVMVKHKTCWTPAAHVKVTFSFFLERINKKYESFESIIIPTKKLQWKFANKSQCIFYGLVNGA